jgi:hypothetical protein
MGEDDEEEVDPRTAKNIQIAKQNAKKNAALVSDSDEDDLEESSEEEAPKLVAAKSSGKKGEQK